jgi:hypothetical protein
MVTQKTEQMNETDARWALFRAISEVVDSGRMPDDDGKCYLSWAVDRYAQAIREAPRG